MRNITLTILMTISIRLSEDDNGSYCTRWQEATVFQRGMAFSFLRFGLCLRPTS